MVVADVAPRAANIPGNYIGICEATPSVVSGACMEAEIGAINAARAQEPVSLPALVLPGGFYSMPQIEQLMVVLVAAAMAGLLMLAGAVAGLLASLR